MLHNSSHARPSLEGISTIFVAYQKKFDETVINSSITSGGPPASYKTIRSPFHSTYNHSFLESMSTMTGGAILIGLSFPKHARTACCLPQCQPSNVKASSGRGRGRGQHHTGSTAATAAQPLRHSRTTHGRRPHVAAARYLPQLPVTSSCPPRPPCTLTHTLRPPILSANPALLPASAPPWTHPHHPHYPCASGGLRRRLHRRLTQFRRQSPVLYGTVKGCGVRGRGTYIYSYRHGGNQCIGVDSHRGSGRAVLPASLVLRRG
eukprot:COSAG01_NODE_10509_length_2149_cov_1.372683_2_plen_262_part_01